MIFLIRKKTDKKNLPVNKTGINFCFVVNDANVVNATPYLFIAVKTNPQKTTKLKYDS